MSKKDLNEGIFTNFKCTKEQREILKALERAREELEAARNFFEMVDNPSLIDYAIYKEAAAQAKYKYLLNEAKNKDIKVGYCLFLDKGEVG